jgi:hypothetical protein
MRALLFLTMIGTSIWLMACSSSASQSETTTQFVTPTAAAETVVTIGPDPLPADFDPAKLVGGWGGEFNFDGDPQSNLIVAQFTVSDVDQLKVDVGFPLLDDVSAVASPVNLSHQADTIKIQFAFPFTRTNSAAAILFDGEFAEGHIVGTVRQGSESGTFELTPIAEFAPIGEEGRT